MLKRKTIRFLLLFILALATILSLNTFMITTVGAMNANWGPTGGTDDLGRTLSQSNKVGEPKSNKNVALFYFLWQGDTEDEGCPINPTSWVISEVVKAHPEVLNDQNSPYWYSPIDSGNFYYWGQSIYNYYRGDDYWVHLKNVQLLTDAGVDILVLDTTNAVTYPKQTNILMNAIDSVRDQGKNPPKIVFYTITNSGDTMQKLYNEFYKTGCTYPHPDDIFYLDGKPLIVGNTSEVSGRNYQNFFAFRGYQWPFESQKTNGWPWIDFQRPQRVYYNSAGQKEIVNVSVAQNSNNIFSLTALYGIPGARGRSYHNGQPGNESVDTPYGYNIQEQWDYAIAQDAPFIFITGWNEWIAGRWTWGNNYSNFLDTVNAEYSRDIEPTLTGNLKDNYYMQMIENIRRYKGVDRIPTPGASKTISSFTDWSDVTPVYKDYTGDTIPRNIKGAPDGIEYMNTTGRNDFDVMKVERDTNNLYFYAKTVSNITTNTGDNWMRLYLNFDNNTGTGWNGYDYRVIGGNTLQQYTSGSWNNVHTVTYIVNLNEMMITVPRSYVSYQKPLEFQFKWSDNMQNDNDPLDWYVNGDVSPGGRLNYIYSEVGEQSPTKILDPTLTKAPRIGAVASTFLNTSWSPDNAIDGNNSTCWSSSLVSQSDTPQWIYIDMGSDYNVKQVKLTPRTNPTCCFPVDFKFQYSLDGNNWADVPGQSYTNYLTPNGTEQTFEFGTIVSARYIRLYATKLSMDDYNAYYEQLAEFNVYYTQQSIVVTSQPTDQNDIAITKDKLKDLTEVNVQLQVLSSGLENSALFVTFYDASNKLLYIAPYNGTIRNGKVNIQINNVPTNVAKMKIICWDGYSSMQSLMVQYEI